MNNKTQLAIVLYVYEQFAIDTKDVAKHFGMTGKKAYEALRALEDMELVCGTAVNEDCPFNGYMKGVRRIKPGVNLTWQCERCYDDYTLDQVTAWASEKLGITSEAAS